MSIYRTQEYHLLMKVIIILLCKPNLQLTEFSWSKTVKKNCFVWIVKTLLSLRMLEWRRVLNPVSFCNNFPLIWQNKMFRFGTHRSQQQQVNWQTLSVLNHDFCWLELDSKRGENILFCECACTYLWKYQFTPFTRATETLN